MTAISSDILVGDVDKNQTQLVRVQLRTYEGRRFIDLRIHFRGRDEVVLPTGKGFAIRPDLIRPLIGQLEQAENLARAQGLLPNADHRKAG